MNKGEIDTETERLKHFETICIIALNEFSENHPERILDSEKEKILLLISRMFNAEFDFLTQNPNDYFQIYGH